MSKFVVAIFPTEAQAYEGTRVMKDLQAEGSLVVYGMAVVTKAADGKLAVKETADKGPVGEGFLLSMDGALCPHLPFRLRMDDKASRAQALPTHRSSDSIKT